MKRYLLGMVVMLSLAIPNAIAAQSSDETLADIRQELSQLHVEIQRLKRELSTTGNGGGLVAAQGTAERLDALEAELARVTGVVERLDNRVNRVVSDGTNRIGDLEFRLVELEGGDLSQLGETTTLGGDEGFTQLPPVVVETPITGGGGELALSERDDYERALAQFVDGQYEASAEAFLTFTTNYPGGPLSSDAHYWRGEAFANLEQWNKAARSFLESFSGGPESSVAPRALLRLGVSLDKIGQTEEACLTLNEVNVRYPDSDATLEALAQMRLLQCG